MQNLLLARLMAEVIKKNILNQRIKSILFFYQVYHTLIRNNLNLFREY